MARCRFWFTGGILTKRFARKKIRSYLLKVKEKTPEASITFTEDKTWLGSLFSVDVRGTSTVLAEEGKDLYRNLKEQR